MADALSEQLGQSGNASDLYSGSSRFESGWGTLFFRFASFPGRTLSQIMLGLLPVKILFQFVLHLSSYRSS